MYYYHHHIGDYRRDTGHLNLLEHGIYRQLLDLYYITEKPLDANAMRLVCVRTEEEQEAFRRVLSDFFDKQDGKWSHKRCDEEIKFFHEKSGKAKESANKRWNKNKDLKNANALPTNSESNANGMLTKNQEPRTKNQQKTTTKTTSTLEKPSEVSDQIWEDFLTLRKAKKAPVNQTVLNLIKSQADKAGWSLESALSECVARGWVGFKADWVKGETKKDFWEGRRVI
jgi:uncharacterized protein YdaU (DUF1376 family)